MFVNIGKKYKPRRRLSVRFKCCLALIITSVLVLDTPLALLGHLGAHDATSEEIYNVSGVEIEGIENDVLSESEESITDEPEITEENDEETVVPEEESEEVLGDHQISHVHFAVVDGQIVLTIPEGSLVGLLATGALEIVLPDGYTDAVVVAPSDWVYDVSENPVIIQLTPPTGYEIEEISNAFFVITADVDGEDVEEEVESDGESESDEEEDEDETGETSG